LYADEIPDPQDCELTVNNFAIHGHPSGTQIAYDGNIPFATTCNLSFTSSRFGNATGSVASNQDSVNITSPGSHDTLATGQDILVQWDAGGSSDFYLVYVGLNLYDSLDTFLLSRNWERPVQVDHYIIPWDSLTAPGCAYAWVMVQVYPTKGPFPEPGAQGNLTGDVEGFLYAWGFTDLVSFYVGTPVKGSVPMAIKEPMPAERLEAIKELTGY
ncbi:MAG: hypothetical protein ABIN58_01435, partial [candidate division WOR-3 bacterium]